MKIAFFSDCYLDLTGGIVTAINAEKKELEKRGHTVYVFSSAYPKTEKEQKTLAKNHIFPVPSCKVFGRGLTPIARHPKIIESYLQKNFPELKDFDIFYIHYEAGCSIAGIRLARKINIPVVQVMHGREDAGEESLIPKGLRTFVAASLNLFHSWYLPHKTTVKKDDYLAKTRARAKMWTLMTNHANVADLVITPSEHFAKKLKHYGVKKPLKVLHHALPDDLAMQKVAPKKYHGNEVLELIWASRLNPEKRLLPFLKSLQNLDREKYHLSLYGTGPDEKKAKKFVKKHHLNADFYGAVPFKKLQKAFEKAHLNILVSYDYDTFGMSIIEAAAFGLPTLLADKDLTEVLPKDSYILARTRPTMTDSLNKLFIQSQAIEQMSKNLITIKPHLKISKKIDKLEEIFEKLIKNHEF